jgi:hypothetical protein
MKIFSWALMMASSDGFLAAAALGAFGLAGAGRLAAAGGLAAAALAAIGPVGEEGLAAADLAAIGPAGEEGLPAAAPVAGGVIGSAVAIWASAPRGLVVLALDGSTALACSWAMNIALPTRLTECSV